MGRVAKGTVRLLKAEHPKPGREKQWHGKWTLDDGTRTDWLPLDPKIGPHDRAGAEACAASMTPDVRAAGANEGKGETVEAYTKRWCEWREGRGKRCVADDRTRLAHALPTIGRLPITSITRDDLKGLVATLDATVRKGFTINAAGRRRPFSWKTAGLVWGAVQSLFRDAQKAKRVDLCVRRDNPTDGIEGPDTGTKKAKTYLWPSEFLAVVSREDVPLRWRRLFALAVYTFARAGELAALEWKSDVDLEHGTIHIHRSKDEQRGRGTNPTKSSTARRIPIEPALMPLLRAMHAEAKGKGAVVTLPADGLSEKLRAYLKRAGIERDDLFTSDATRKAMTFHDLRATGITWCAVRGDDPLKIMQRAGHTEFSTTQIYLREAENLSRGFGDVFPPLPACLLGIAPQSPRAIQNARSTVKTGRSKWPLRGSNSDALTGRGF